MVKHNAANIGYRHWRIAVYEMMITLKQIYGARQTSALNRHCL